MIHLYPDYGTLSLWRAMCVCASPIPHLFHSVSTLRASTTTLATCLCFLHVRMAQQMGTGGPDTGTGRSIQSSSNRSVGSRRCLFVEVLKVRTGVLTGVAVTTFRVCPSILREIQAQFEDRAIEIPKLSSAHDPPSTCLAIKKWRSHSSSPLTW